MRKLFIQMLITLSLAMTINSGVNSKEVSTFPIKDLIHYYDTINYNQKAWKAKDYKTPRLTFATIGKHWDQESRIIPVQDKKSVFFRLMLPLILISNEQISTERNIIMHSDLSNSRVIYLAIKYKIIKTAVHAITAQQKTQLLQKVDIIPPTLALAQAAEESGWGTSRFTLEGNAFFGQWNFSGHGMIPNQQRKELGNYRVSSYDSPLKSTESYMFSLNTVNAYENLRILRADLRHHNKPITGIKLSNELLHYSERGAAYPRSLQHIIQYNNLEGLDDAFLVPSR
ncbi:MAG: glucosaminidase domain-containing protein [Psychromonas sp.]|nr:glucosaminidase domain-containing protein [Psychromonas sp.]